MGERRFPVAARAGALLLFALALAFAARALDGGGGGDGEPLRIGHLASYSGPLGYIGPVVERGVALAIRHVNAAGGVRGRPVSYVAADTGGDPARAVREARRLIGDEGVHAIVGGSGSEVTLTFAEAVAGRLGVPTITPSASSPALAAAADGGYLFRAIGSAETQAIALAGLAASDGIDRVGALVRDDAWGRGYLEAFAAAFGGRIAAATYAPDGQPSYLGELRRAAEGGAEWLIAISFPPETGVFVAEALRHGLFSRFLFTDGSKSLDLIGEVGAERLEGFRGTAAGTDSAGPAARAWDAGYAAAFGGPPAPGSPHAAYVVEARAAYDATIAIALAAEAAGSTGGAAIRDRLPAVAGPPGRAFLPGPGGVRAALAAVRAGEDANYEGAATPLDWNADGEVADALVEIWEFRGGRIVTLELRPVTLR